MSSFDCKVRLHANQEIEFKLHYPVSSKSKNKYGFNVYFFIPKQLNITSRTFSLNKFFSKLKTYIRYEISGLSIENLLNRTCIVSPYSRILKLFEDTPDLNFLDIDYIDYELKTFFNIANARIIEKSKDIKKAMRKGRLNSFPLSDLSHQIFSEFVQIREKMQLLKDLFYQQPVDSVLRKAFDWVDEGLSMTFERSLWIINKAANIKGNEELDAKSQELLAQELTYRESQGYANFIKQKDTLACEGYLFRQQSIKKWAEGIMYMKLKRTKNAERIGELLFGFAAIAAMAVSLSLMFVGEHIRTLQPDVVESVVDGVSSDGGENLSPSSSMSPTQAISIYWVLLALFVYMLKDRIKEALRRLFSKIIPKIVSDREQYLFDRKTKKRCGRVKDWVHFSSQRKLPENVAKLRMYKKNRLDRLLVREDILSFHHEIKIDGSSLVPGHSRMSALTEINRIDLESFFAGMDKAFEKVYYLDSDGLKKIKTQRVYHITAIVELVDNRDTDQKNKLVRYRITANKSGLLRVSEVASL
ncbi:MAG: hypothetical protein JXR63_07475 [Spirochaetales bacterium]|nr:hypothetical protein [Spirochaetales bacterium]